MRWPIEATIVRDAQIPSSTNNSKLIFVTLFILMIFFSCHLELQTWWALYHHFWSRSLTIRWSGRYYCYQQYRWKLMFSLECSVIFQFRIWQRNCQTLLPWNDFDNDNKCAKDNKWTQPQQPFLLRVIIISVCPHWPTGTIKNQ